MSFEVLKSISDAEEAAREARLSAQSRAKNMIAEADKKGQAAVAEAVTRAEEEVKKRLAEAELTASEKATGQREVTAENQAEIRRHAGSRLNDAAGMIVERIVNG